MCSGPDAHADFYRPPTPRNAPLYRVVADRYDQSERVYPDRFQRHYGFWRPVVGRAVGKYLQCGDLRRGFARVRCPECGGEMKIVAFIEARDQADLIERILKHGGPWQPPASRSPPEPSSAPDQRRQSTLQFQQAAAE